MRQDKGIEFDQTPANLVTKEDWELILKLEERLLMTVGDISSVMKIGCSLCMNSIANRGFDPYFVGIAHHETLTLTQAICFAATRTKWLK